MIGEQGTVIVTGANVGLGNACAGRLAQLKPNWALVLACPDWDKAEAVEI